MGNGAGRPMETVWRPVEGEGGEHGVGTWEGGKGEEDDGDNTRRETERALLSRPVLRLECRMF